MVLTPRVLFKKNNSTCFALRFFTVRRCARRGARFHAVSPRFFRYFRFARSGRCFRRTSPTIGKAPPSLHLSCLRRRTPVLCCGGFTDPNAVFSRSNAVYRFPAFNPSSVWCFLLLLLFVRIAFTP